MGNDFRNYFSEKIVVKIFVVCKGLKWNIPPSLKASSMYHLFDVHTFLNLTKRVCVLSTYLHSLLNNVWYVSVPNLIPLRRPSGVSLLLLSNCRAFKSLIVIHLNIALQWENTTDNWIQILQYYFKDWWAENELNPEIRKSDYTFFISISGKPPHIWASEICFAVSDDLVSTPPHCNIRWIDCITSAKLQQICQ